ncbi:glycoside hydrolase family 15 protein [Nocardioides marmoriginsengisoli]|uniref:Glycoside hydrolase family 15 protein n=1 Tax=Nocardioides marmoriginsengisoli TaxID=661483 RepID=A0A3N0CNI8_9ACTN|nr:glycoside hydrolase family 15 protein [Nocardioides marmoriginsengisoli]RNL65044.1 glycoside hydrolase family 15 protein [Nocardioides marmoriginsengisoli]
MGPIEDYGIIGDRHTAALIGLDGSVDWLCLPRFDSASCFSRLLGDPDSSRWLLGPAGEHTSTRRYLDGTNVLETTHTTATGEVQVLDLMPTGDRRADVVRRITGVRGTVRVRHEFTIRFDYGRIRPWVHRVDTGDGLVIVAVAGPDKVILAGPRLPDAVGGHHQDEFEVSAGEVLDFSLTWVPSHRDVPPRLDLDSRIASTLAEQRDWLAAAPDQGPFAAAVNRSLLTLYALTDEDTGGIVAAPTTSLPEDFGGVRNWDYRYSWLRDAALTVEAMIGDDHPERARPWRDWLLRAIAGDPEDLQVMYAVDGSRHLPETELDHLAGYAGSRPVRIGNGAVGQRQGDVIGEVLVALAAARDLGLTETTDSWSLQRTLANGIAESWHLPDNGIWEIRGPQRHFTHSRVMMWAGLDRMIRGVERHGLRGPVDEWRRVRDEIRSAVLDSGYDADRGTFTQHDATTEVDASLLLLPLVGFVEAGDPRMLGTLARIEEDLLRDGLLMRYRTGSGVDGLSGDEHPFLACSFWLAAVYARVGRTAEAEALMTRLVALSNDVGLLSEEYDVTGDRMAGNFPQAFSHLALIQAARVIERSRV